MAKALPKLGFKSEEIEFEDGRTYVKNGGFDSDATIRWQQAVRTQNVESSERDPFDSNVAIVRFNRTCRRSRCGSNRLAPRVLGIAE